LKKPNISNAEESKLPKNYCDDPKLKNYNKLKQNKQEPDL